jgi:hypothetical protein
VGKAGEVAVVCGREYATVEWVLPTTMVHRGEG